METPVEKYFRKSYENADNKFEQYKENEKKIGKVFGKIFKVIFIGTGYVVVSMVSWLASEKDAAKDYKGERDNFSSVVISNGEVVISNDVTRSNYMSNDDITKPSNFMYHNSIENIEYEVNYFDQDKVLVIYTYGEDDTVRKAVTDYIVSNISINEDKKICFWLGYF